MVDWGFLPNGHFGVDERFGRRSDLKRLIDEAHQRSLAVIVGLRPHLGGVPYAQVYRHLN